MNKNDREILEAAVWENYVRERNEQRGVIQVNIDSNMLKAAKRKYLQAQQEVPATQAAKIGHSLDKLGNFLREAIPIWDEV